MAKKKKVKRASKKPARSTKARGKKVASRATAGGKPTKKRPRGSTSVDGILNRYKKERALQETQLANVRKKIADLEAKVRSYQDQIAKLNQQESATLRQVEQLDAKRDQEVGELLSKLGVRVGQDSLPGSGDPGKLTFGGGGNSDE